MMEQKIRVCLLSVESSDPDEYADLEGEMGILHITNGESWFESNYQSLIFGRPKITEHKDKMSVKTQYGNTFSFHVVPKEQRNAEVRQEIEKLESKIKKLREELK